MRSFSLLRPYLRPFRGLIAISVLLALPLAGLRAAPAALVKFVVDDLFVTRDPRKLFLYPALILALFLVNFAVRFFHYYCLRVVIARVNQRLKNDLYEHLLGLSAEHFTRNTSGGLISRVASDPNLVDGGIQCINVAAREPLTFLFLFGYALHLNWKLTLFTLLVFPPLAWVFARSGKLLKRYINRYAEGNAAIYSVIQESVTGVRTVFAYGLQKYVRKKFREQNADFTRNHLKIALIEEAAHPLVELLIAVVAALMVGYGGFLLVQGELTPGDLLAFFAAFAMMVNPLKALNDVNLRLNQAAAALDRIGEVLSWRSGLREAADPAPVADLAREIRLEGVRFAYPDAPEHEVLRGVSFTVERGQVVALVGASGAGKSSLASLLPRIFDPTGGRILYDGKDLRELELDGLRRRIAVVSQDVFLFNDTIEENIRCGRLSATREEIREAARRAHAEEFIAQLPGGYATVIGDRGQKLSGGQRQRLSIARAFLRAAPVLILDEATSSLDTASEKLVQRALEELMVERTTIVIAHRLSTIRGADRILVMKDGEVVESGVHDELLARGGVYAHLHGEGLR
jgi:ATP-binding cassette, subfamily B, bacterial MsbA